MTKAIKYIELAKVEKAHNGRSALFWHILANRRRLLLKEMKEFAQHEDNINTLTMAPVSA
jgi:hypothetical protein